MKKRMITLLAMLAGAMAHADIANFDVQMLVGGVMQKENSSANLTAGSVYMVIADGSNDGLNMDSLWDMSLFTSDSYLDNEIIYKSTAIDFEGLTYLWTGTSEERGSAFNAYNDLVGANDTYYLVWFEGLSDVDGTPTAGSWVGSITYSSSDANWRLPPANGAVGDSGTYASLAMNDVSWVQAVPEPASALLVAIGGGMVYALRRKQNLLAR